MIYARTRNKCKTRPAPTEALRSSRRDGGDEAEFQTQVPSGVVSERKMPSLRQKRKLGEVLVQASAGRATAIHNSSVRDASGNPSNTHAGLCNADVTADRTKVAMGSSDPRAITGQQGKNRGSLGAVERASVCETDHPAEICTTSDIPAKEAGDVSQGKRVKRKSLGDRVWKPGKMKQKVAKSNHGRATSYNNAVSGVLNRKRKRRNLLAGIGTVSPDMVNIVGPRTRHMAKTGTDGETAYVRSKKQKLSGTKGKAEVPIIAEGESAKILTTKLPNTDSKLGSSTETAELFGELTDIRSIAPLEILGDASGLKHVPLQSDPMLSKPVEPRSSEERVSEVPKHKEGRDIISKSLIPRVTRGMKSRGLDSIEGAKESFPLEDDPLARTRIDQQVDQAAVDPKFRSRIEGQVVQAALNSNFGIRIDDEQVVQAAVDPKSASGVDEQVVHPGVPMIAIKSASMMLRSQKNLGEIKKLSSSGRPRRQSKRDFLVKDKDVLTSKDGVLNRIAIKNKCLGATGIATSDAKLRNEESSVNREGSLEDDNLIPGRVFTGLLPRELDGGGVKLVTIEGVLPRGSNVNVQSRSEPETERGLLHVVSGGPRQSIGRGRTKNRDDKDTNSANECTEKKVHRSGHLRRLKKGGRLRNSKGQIVKRGIAAVVEKNAFEPGRNGQQDEEMQQQNMPVEASVLVVREPSNEIPVLLGEQTIDVQCVERETLQTAGITQKLEEVQNAGYKEEDGVEESEKLSVLKDGGCQQIDLGQEVLKIVRVKSQDCVRKNFETVNHRKRHFKLGRKRVQRVQEEAGFLRETRAIRLANGSAGSKMGKVLKDVGMSKEMTGKTRRKKQGAGDRDSSEIARNSSSMVLDVSIKSSGIESCGKTTIGYVQPSLKNADVGLQAEDRDLGKGPVQEEPSVDDHQSQGKLPRRLCVPDKRKRGRPKNVRSTAVVAEGNSLRETPKEVHTINAKELSPQKVKSTSVVAEGNNLRETREEVHTINAKELSPQKVRSTSVVAEDNSLRETPEAVHTINAKELSCDDGVAAGIVQSDAVVGKASSLDNVSKVTPEFPQERGEPKFQLSDLQGGVQAGRAPMKRKKLLKNKNLGCRANYSIHTRARDSEGKYASNIQRQGDINGVEVHSVLKEPGEAGPRSGVDTRKLDNLDGPGFKLKISPVGVGEEGVVFNAKDSGAFSSFVDVSLKQGEELSKVQNLFRRCSPSSRSTFDVKGLIESIEHSPGEHAGLVEKIGEEDSESCQGSYVDKRGDVWTNDAAFLPIAVEVIEHEKSLVQQSLGNDGSALLQVKQSGALSNLLEEMESPLLQVKLRSQWDTQLAFSSGSLLPDPQKVVEVPAVLYKHPDSPDGPFALEDVREALRAVHYIPDQAWSDAGLNPEVLQSPLPGLETIRVHDCNSSITVDTSSTIIRLETSDCVTTRDKAHSIATSDTSDPLATVGKSAQIVINEESDPATTICVYESGPVRAVHIPQSIPIIKKTDSLTVFDIPDSVTAVDRPESVTAMVMPDSLTTSDNSFGSELLQHKLMACEIASDREDAVYSAEEEKALDGSSGTEEVVSSQLERINAGASKVAFVGCLSKDDVSPDIGREFPTVHCKLPGEDSVEVEPLTAQVEGFASRLQDHGMPQEKSTVEVPGKEVTQEPHSQHRGKFDTNLARDKFSLGRGVEYLTSSQVAPFKENLILFQKVSCTELLLSLHPSAEQMSTSRNFSSVNGNANPSSFLHSFPNNESHFQLQERKESTTASSAERSCQDIWKDRDTPSGNDCVVACAGLSTSQKIPLDYEDLEQNLLGNLSGDTQLGPLAADKQSNDCGDSESEDSRKSPTVPSEPRREAVSIAYSTLDPSSLPEIGASVEFQPSHCPPLELTDQEPHLESPKIMELEQCKADCTPQQGSEVDELQNCIVLSKRIEDRVDVSSYRTSKSMHFVAGELEVETELLEGSCNSIADPMDKQEAISESSTSRFILEDDATADGEPSEEKFPLQLETSQHNRSVDQGYSVPTSVEENPIGCDEPILTVCDAELENRIEVRDDVQDVCAEIVEVCSKAEEVREEAEDVHSDLVAPTEAGEGHTGVEDVPLEVEEVSAELEEVQAEVQDVLGDVQTKTQQVDVVIKEVLPEAKGQRGGEDGPLEAEEIYAEVEMVYSAVDDVQAEAQEVDAARTEMLSEAKGHSRVEDVPLDAQELCAEIYDIQVEVEDVEADLQTKAQEVDAVTVELLSEAKGHSGVEEVALEAEEVCAEAEELHAELQDVYAEAVMTELPSEAKGHTLTEDVPLVVEEVHAEIQDMQAKVQEVDAARTEVLSEVKGHTQVEDVPLKAEELCAEMEDIQAEVVDVEADLHTKAQEVDAVTKELLSEAKGQSRVEEVALEAEEVCAEREELHAEVPNVQTEAHELGAAMKEVPSETKGHTRVEDVPLVVEEIQAEIQDMPAKAQDVDAARKEVLFEAKVHTGVEDVPLKVEDVQADVQHEVEDIQADLPTKAQEVDAVLKDGISEAKGHTGVEDVALEAEEVQTEVQDVQTKAQEVDAVMQEVPSETQGHRGEEDVPPEAEEVQAEVLDVQAKAQVVDAAREEVLFEGMEQTGVEDVPLEAEELCAQVEDVQAEVEGEVQADLPTKAQEVGVVVKEAHSEAKGLSGAEDVALEAEEFQAEVQDVQAEAQGADAVMEVPSATMGHSGAEDLSLEVVDVSPEVEDVQAEVQNVQAKAQEVLSEAKGLSGAEDVTLEAEEFQAEVQDVQAEAQGADAVMEVPSETMGHSGAEDLPLEVVDVSPEVEEVQAEVQNVQAKAQEVLSEAKGLSGAEDVALEAEEFQAEVHDVQAEAQGADPVMEVPSETMGHSGAEDLPLEVVDVSPEVEEVQAEVQNVQAKAQEVLSEAMGHTGAEDEVDELCAEVEDVQVEVQHVPADFQTDAQEVDTETKEVFSEAKGHSKPEEVAIEAEEVCAEVEEVQAELQDVQTKAQDVDAVMEEVLSEAKGHSAAEDLPPEADKSYGKLEESLAEGQLEVQDVVTDLQTTAQEMDGETKEVLLEAKEHTAEDMAVEAEEVCADVEEVQAEVRDVQTRDQEVDAVMKQVLSEAKWHNGAEDVPLELEEVRAEVEEVQAEALDLQAKAQEVETVTKEMLSEPKGHSGAEYVVPLEVEEVFAEGKEVQADGQDVQGEPQEVDSEMEEVPVEVREVDAEANRSMAERMATMHELYNGILTIANSDMTSAQDSFPLSKLVTNGVSVGAGRPELMVQEDMSRPLTSEFGLLTCTVENNGFLEGDVLNPEEPSHGHMKTHEQKEEDRKSNPLRLEETASQRSIADGVKASSISKKRKLRVGTESTKEPEFLLQKRAWDGHEGGDGDEDATSRVYSKKRGFLLGSTAIESGGMRIRPRPLDPDQSIPVLLEGRDKDYYEYDGGSFYRFIQQQEEAKLRKLALDPSGGVSDGGGSSFVSKTSFVKRPHIFIPLFRKLTDMTQVGAIGRRPEQHCELGIQSSFPGPQAYLRCAKVAARKLGLGLGGSFTTVPSVYDMDDEDEDWLQEYNENLKQSGLDQALSDDTFEQLIEVFEREFHRICQSSQNTFPALVGDHHGNGGASGKHVKRLEAESSERGRSRIKKKKNNAKVSKSQGFFEGSVFKRETERKSALQNTSEYCCICNGGDQVYRCQICSIRVHQSCYGICPTEGNESGRHARSPNWCCRKCEAVVAGTALPNISCAICCKSGGAMKPTVDPSKWAHVACALYTNETYFVDSEAMEPVDGLAAVETRVKKLKERCGLCGVREGSCVRCSSRGCRAPFHISCGVIQGASFELRHMKQLVVGVRSFCPRHASYVPGANTEDNQCTPSARGADPAEQLPAVSTESSDSIEVGQVMQRKAGTAMEGAISNGAGWLLRDADLTQQDQLNRTLKEKSTGTKDRVTDPGGVTPSSGFASMSENEHESSETLMRRGLMLKENMHMVPQCLDEADVSSPPNAEEKLEFGAVSMATSGSSIHLSSTVENVDHLGKVTSAAGEADPVSSVAKEKKGPIKGKSVMQEVDNSSPVPDSAITEAVSPQELCQSLPRLENLATTLAPPLIVEAVYSHWQSKRARARGPILHEFKQLQAARSRGIFNKLVRPSKEFLPVVGHVSPARIPVTRRPRSVSRDPVLSRILDLRQQLEMLRTIAGNVVRREQLKHEDQKLLYESAQQQLLIARGESRIRRCHWCENTQNLLGCTSCPRAFCFLCFKRRRGYGVKGWIAASKLLKYVCNFCLGGTVQGSWSELSSSLLSRTFSDGSGTSASGLALVPGRLGDWTHNLDVTANLDSYSRRPSSNLDSPGNLYGSDTSSQGAGSTLVPGRGKMMFTAQTADGQTVYTKFAVPSTIEHSRAVHRAYNGEVFPSGFSQTDGRDTGQSGHQCEADKKLKRRAKALKKQVEIQANSAVTKTKRLKKLARSSSFVYGSEDETTLSESEESIDKKTVKLSDLRDKGITRQCINTTETCVEEEEDRPLKFAIMFSSTAGKLILRRHGA